MRLKTILKYTLIWGLASFILLELSLRLLGFQVLQIPDKFIESQPQGCIMPDSILGFKLSPGKYEVTLNNHLKYTAHHNSNSERNTFNKDDENLKKIFLYGCSYTYGMGINDDESYPYLIDKSLVNYKIHNKAVPGFGTIQALISLNNGIANDILPDIVILNYYQFHDERNILNRAYREKLYLGRRSNITLYNGTSNKNTSLSWEFPYYNKENKQIKNINVNDIYPTMPFRENSALINIIETEYNRISSNEGKAREVSHEIIKEISRLCEKHGIKFFLANMDELDKDLELLCQSENISIIDSYVDLNQENYRNRPYDYHPSPIAHKEYARLILNFLTKNNIQ